LLAFFLWSCGPDKLRTCSGEDPAFTVVLKLAARPLPADTVVHVTYAGSAKEDFRLSDPDARHKVTFCRPADKNGAPLDASAPETTLLDGGGGAAGAAGATGSGAESLDPNVVAALYCELWTAGFTELSISGSGFTTVDYDLTPKDDECTIEKECVLDSPDPALACGSS
jgi:hypothetical protein